MMVVMLLIEVGVKFIDSGYGVRVVIKQVMMMLLWTAKLSQNWRMQTRSR